MLVGRCASKLSNHKLQAKLRKSQALSEAPHRVIAGTTLVARSRRTSAVLILPTLLGAFQPPKPDNRIRALDLRPGLLSAVPLG
jgi:hypothetical protein